eukprot:scaffold32283_cov54-Attheya_sp.AAC.13
MKVSYDWLLTTGSDREARSRHLSDAINSRDVAVASIFAPTTIPRLEATDDGSRQAARIAGASESVSQHTGVAQHGRLPLVPSLITLRRCDHDDKDTVA